MRAYLVICALSLMPCVAGADVIGPDDPRVMCPIGAQRITTHCGTVCVPLRCTGDGDCFGGRVCRPVRICINTEPGCGLGGLTYERVYGDCASPCVMGSCTGIMACVDPDVDAGPPDVDSGADLDSGAGDTDSGAGDTDSGATGMDSGSGVDSGSGTDSGAGAVDAGTGESDGGCGCGVSGRSTSPWLLALGLALVALLARRRRA